MYEEGCYQDILEADQGFPTPDQLDSKQGLAISCCNETNMHSDNLGYPACFP